MADVLISMEPRLFDTHAHVQFNAFKNDGHDVIKRSLDQGVWLNLIGTQIDTSKRAIEYAEHYPEGVYALIALHPIHLFSTYVDEEEIQFKSREEIFDPALYRELAKSKKVIGIGECGLDYYRINDVGQPIEVVKQKQREVFKQHLDLAHELDLPLSIHCREAYDDLYDVLVEYKRSLSSKPHPNPLLRGEGEGEVRGIMHCYLGTWEQAQKFLDLGFLISFSGIVTFKNATSLQEVVRQVPLEQMTVETDCPYLSPEPYRGKRCEPAYVEWTAKKIAELKGVTFQEVAEKTTENARRFFDI